jgi:FKBP-type peptidyl-prolyl cis-trans isomerase SlyD
MTDALTAERDRVVSFHYVLRDADGTELESSRGGEPVAVLIGHHNVMPSLEDALTGHQAGDHFETTLEPALAFGEYRDNWTQRISKKYVPNAARVRPGMQVELQTDSGSRTVTVLKVGGKVLDVDLNHPFAGKTVTFAVEMVDVRDASPEELSHGHAHGAGGHHH